MTADEIKIDVVTDLADVPGWIDMVRDYLEFAVIRHVDATGQFVVLDGQLNQTVAQIGKFIGPDGRFIIAKNVEGSLVGMVMMHRLANGKGEFKRMFIRPEARRMGLAKRLMARLESEARAMGLTTLYLDTTIGLPEAIALYKSLGFEDAEHDAESVQDPELLPYLVFMEKALLT